MNWILERRNLGWSEFTPAMHAGARVCGSRYAVLCVRPEEMTGTSPPTRGIQICRDLIIRFTLRYTEKRYYAL